MQFVELMQLEQLRRLFEQLNALRARPDAAARSRPARRARAPCRRARKPPEAARDPARLFRTPFAVTGTAACPMNLFSRLTLADACLRFDAADRNQRLAVQALAMPMLAQRLTWLRLVLRASPDSAATRSTIGRIERALASARARLGLAGECGTAATA
ncbi:hypothetical protein [Burkholderia ubonensis]|uniref:hypothetical protein n=1 Tax=Burkholderia ubonensis TaxID=101571 RepID=UPI001E52D33E|nr:hypothetical protein [Burkholderia ubonensis]